MANKVFVAAGFIVFRRVNKQIEYLLLQASDGIHHWTPPKGHVDPGEKEIEAAFRETAEEAGLSKNNLHVVDGFEKVLEYKARGYPKKVIYWLAQLEDPKTPVVISHEHQRYAWFDLDAAVSHADYEIMKQLLQEADHFVRHKFKL